MKQAAALVLLAANAALADGTSHQDEITFFANTMAIAKTVKTSCPALTVDDRFLERLRLQLHVVEADQPTFAQQARHAADQLQRAFKDAPSGSAWCTATFNLYGPDGALMQGMLRKP